MDPITGGILSAVLGMFGANKAASAQTSAANAQLNFNREVYADQKAAFAPWLQMGLQGQQAYNSLLGLGQAPEGFAGYEASPGYQWQLGQGMDAAQSSAAARGGLNSGKTLQDLTAFGQGLASQDFGNYLNRLAGIGQQGMAAAGQQAAAAGQYGVNGMNALGSMGDARAAGIIGGANAWGQGIGNAIQGYGYMQGTGQPMPGWWSSMFGGQ